MSVSWKNYIVPPLFVGLAAYINGVFVDGQLPDSPILFLDVFTNMIAYDTSILFSEYVLDKAVTGGVMQDGLNRVAEPVMQGLVNAAIPHLGIKKTLMGNYASLSYARGAEVAPVANKTFADRFIEGATLNIAATYLSEPLTA